MVSPPRSSLPTADSSAANGRASASRGADVSTSAFPASSNGAGSKRQLAEPEVIALNELLDTFPSEMDDAQQESGAETHKRRKVHNEVAASYQRHKPYEREAGRSPKEERTQTLATRSGPGSNAGSTGSAIRHTKLTDLEQHVRNLERDNLHLKQALLLGKNAAGRNAAGAAAALSSLAGARRENRANTQRLLAERTKVVTEMVELLNAAYLSLGDASRVWHEDCRIGVGVREWDAFGRLQTISLWNMIRSVFTSIVVDIVELRPHLPDGEMILTKWRIQGEIASAQHLERVCASEDCPATMRVALMAIKSSDLTFTVTTYVVFQELRIAQQHHCWDQVGVFKRLFGGEIPTSETATGLKQPLEV
ncbi:hypothetical protein GQ600_7320 [Phytophthora cactorum]|nr:hypothetical protein GQ600_7320 [Phytophthora cactorum]